MKTPGGPRVVWALGLLAYLFGGLVFGLAPILIPFLGAIVLLACASSTVRGPRTDWPIMIAAIIEGAVGTFAASLSTARPAWLEPIVISCFYIGAILPIVMILYRLVRPFA
jgi:hypothetical protein